MEWNSDRASIPGIIEWSFDSGGVADLVIFDAGSPTLDLLWKGSDLVAGWNGEENAYVGAGAASANAPTNRSELKRTPAGFAVNTTDGGVARIGVGWTSQPEGISLLLPTDVLVVVVAEGSATTATLADFEGGIHAGSSRGARFHANDAMEVGSRETTSLTTMHWSVADEARGSLRVRTSTEDQVIDMTRSPRIDCPGAWVWENLRFTHAGPAELQLDLAGDGRRTWIQLTTVEFETPLAPLWEIYRLPEGDPCARTAIGGNAPFTILG